MEVAMNSLSSGNVFFKAAVKMISGVVLAAMFAVNCPVIVNGAVIRQPEIDRHGYRRYNWSSPSKSYIVSLSDGGYMTFEGIDKSLLTVEGLTPGYTVDYYDASFNHIKRKKVKLELNLLGGFYSDGNYYYVVSGQENPKESNSVECFRLTKYDKDWKRLGSCGFSNCSTSDPFPCGGASIASSGDIVVFKTNRHMYKSSDGLNHQANITFSVDTSTMTKIISPRNYDTPGYYSHSFNQFIKIDNGHAVSADHGDAYPRDIGVCYYKDPITSNNLGTADFYPAFKIGGLMTVHGNYTGATLGGLEISDSSYIVVGSSEDQDNLPEDGYGRGSCLEDMNVFVSAVNKSSGKASVKWLTSDANDKAGYSNPYIVKVNNNKFVVLWTKGNDTWNVRYAVIDGDGNIQGSVKTTKGYLSECQPVLAGNKIVWYSASTNVYDPLDMIDDYDYDDDDYLGPVYMHSLDLSSGKTTITTLYKLEINKTMNGKASLSGPLAAAGSEVTVNVTPDEGYELSYILVNGKRITGNKFTMPAEETSVTVNFKRIGSPNLDDVVNIGDYSFKVTNSDTEGSGTVMLTGVVNPVEAVVIPATIDINGYIYKVNRIGGTAFFENDTVKTVYLTANVTVIDKNAFYGCPNLVKVSGGAGLKTIGENAFARCPQLSSFIITSKVLYKIGAQAFYKDSKLKTIYIKNTTKLTKSGVKKSMKGSSVKTVKVKKSKVRKYYKYFKKSNSGKKVKVRK